MQRIEKNRNKTVDNGMQELRSNFAGKPGALARLTDYVVKPIAAIDSYIKHKVRNIVWSLSSLHCGRTEQFFNKSIIMALKLIALGLLHLAVANPTNTLQDMQMVDDTASVGTYIRSVRATAPEDFKKSYERESDGVIGYSRKKSGGGKKGYQHFDSYHKKAGDNYELETEDSYGKDEEGQEGAHSQRSERKEKPQKKNPEAADEDVERLTDERPEIDHEELKEGAPDGNGGVEAHGHDPNDYILPEKYTYGEGEEYDF